MADTPKKKFTPEQEREFSEIKADCAAIREGLIYLDEKIAERRDIGYATYDMVFLKNKLITDTDNLELRVANFEAEINRS
jgi:hypothetical protein